mgnify:CR=1 FL=1
MCCEQFQSKAAMCSTITRSVGGAPGRPTAATSSGSASRKRAMLSAMLPLMAVLEQGGKFIQCVKHGVETTGLRAGPMRSRASSAIRVNGPPLPPGVVQMATGAWLDLALEEEEGCIPLDKHGNPNVLTRDVGTSEIAQGSSANSCLVQIERYAGVAPAVACFDPPPLIRKS